jgi:hypothetical protein
MDHISLTTSLNAAELSAIRLDGEVSNEGIEWDIPQSWQIRSTRVLWKERHPLVLTGLSAVWGLTGMEPEPARHTASTVTVNRIRETVNPLLAIEERTLNPVEYWLTEKCGVTTPLRTISDVLRMSEISDEISLQASRLLMTQFHIETKVIVNSIENMISVPHKRMALGRAGLLVR